MPPGRSQQKRWAGEFGRAYTDRNIGDPELLASAFAEVLEGLSPASVLEVGCNRGHNLAALGRVLDAELAGIDVNRYALELARAAVPEASFLEAPAASLPFPPAAFDLVFTVGVLIHVPPDGLDSVIAEVLRVSRRWVLAVEYFAEAEEVVHYRGHDDLLWKRDYGAEYLEREPRLSLLRSGYLGPERGLDRCTWWLFEKPSA